MAVDAAAVQSYLSNALLFMLIAGMAGSCDARLFAVKFKKPNGMLAALFSQFVLLPAIGFLSVNLFPQSAVTVVTLLVVTTSPGGGFSGWWCSLCNADLALSVAMTTASTFACLLALPVNVYLYVQVFYGKEVSIDWNILLLSVVNVVCAVGLGLWVGARMPLWRGKINAAGQLSGVALMGLGCFASSSSGDPISANPPDWFAAVCLPCVLGLVAALGLAKLVGLSSAETVGRAASASAPSTASAPPLPTSTASSTAPVPPASTAHHRRRRHRRRRHRHLRPHRRPAARRQVAVGIECCYQNTGLGLTIALSAFPADQRGKAAGVPLVYGMAEVVVIGAFAVFALLMG
jgi:predicted Na+-dependent transporter